ncbi:MAG TPA: isoprenylcysteine carboxylmethyltransferase family protein [Chthonomonadaceae bacterium]|nr:isoprenylcysteine carboxylmethyltransferase family protein [Chthonomonadaceae bacterium]
MGTASNVSSTGWIERIGHFLFRWRNLLFPLILLGLLLGFPPVPMRGDPRIDRWLDVTGILLALLGQGLRVAVIGYKYIVRGGKKGRVYAEGLVTEGMFNHSRNPLYLGNLLVLTGLFTIHNNPWVYALGLSFFIFAYVAMVVAEEAYLYRRFGAAYQDYCRRVPRWIPDFRGVRESVKGMRFNRKEVVYTEFGSTYTWIVTALLILAYQAQREPPSPQKDTYLLVLASLFLLVTATWVFWRYWKRILLPRLERAAAQRSGQA